MKVDGKKVVNGASEKSLITDEYLTRDEYECIASKILNMKEYEDYTVYYDGCAQYNIKKE
jgi:hypothetical protein